MAAPFIKPLAGIALAASLGLVGYVAAGPWLTIAQIRQGIEMHDSARLAECIDFPSLRENTKAQLRASLIEQGQRESENAVLGLALAGLGSALVDGVVDAALTPEGLAALMAGEDQGGSARDTSDGEGEQPRELFADARFAYDWHDRFSVWVPTDQGTEIRFILARQGLRWRLNNVLLPLD